MRSAKVNYLLVGGFVIAMIAALVVSVALLTGRTGATDGYFTVYRNVTGINFGTQVLYEGYPIGQVETVTPVEAEGGMRFRVEYTVREGWRIPEDSVARIAAPGLLSALTISLRAGASANALDPGSEVKGEDPSDIFAAMSSVASDVTELSQTSLRPLLENLNRTVATFGELLDGDGKVLLRDLAVLTSDIAGRMPKMAEDTEKLLANLVATSTEVQAMFDADARAGLEGRLDSILAQVESATTDFAALTSDLGTTRETADALLSSMGQAVETVNTIVGDNRLDVEASIVDMRYVLETFSRNVDVLNQNLEGASRNMYEFSRQIRQNPGLLLGGTPPPDAAQGQ